MGKFRALIIASDDYDPARGFPRLASAVQEAERFKKALSQHSIQPFEFVVRFNGLTQDVQSDIGQFFSHNERDDTLVFYFSGHGRKDDDGELYLALRDTFAKELIYTGLPAEMLRRMINRSNAACKIIILDCCYSAAIVSGLKGDYLTIDVERFLQGKGMIILSSSNAVQLSYESQAERLSFTHFLTEGLTTGRADLDRDGWIDVEEWFLYAQERVISWQNPQLFSYYREGKIYLARSGAVQAGATAPPPIPEAEEAEPPVMPPASHHQPPPLKTELGTALVEGVPALTLWLSNTGFTPLVGLTISGLNQHSSQPQALYKIDILLPNQSVQCAFPVQPNREALWQLLIDARDTRGRAYQPLVIPAAQVSLPAAGPVLPPAAGKPAPPPWEDDEDENQLPTRDLGPFGKGKTDPGQRSGRFSRRPFQRREDD